jgi:hypothetical protein
LYHAFIEMLLLPIGYKAANARMSIQVNSSVFKLIYLSLNARKSPPQLIVIKYYKDFFHKPFIMPDAQLTRMSLSGYFCSNSRANLLKWRS